MNFNFSNQFYKDLKRLKKENNKIAFKVFDLLNSIDDSHPILLSGLGKPEALKGNYSGLYSRRITEKHRLIYEYVGDTVFILSCFGHYEDK